MTTTKKFGLIDATARRAELADVESFESAVRRVGLTPGKIDFGMIGPRDPKDGSGVTLVVYEFGLFDPVDTQHYFAIGNRLSAGNALLFRHNAPGETIDMIELPKIIFFASVAGVEAAIRAGAIDRPQTHMNGKLVWEWPQPKPSWIKK